MMGAPGGHPEPQVSRLLREEGALGGVMGDEVLVTSCCSRLFVVSGLELKVGGWRAVRCEGE